jgi:hypothetical protein
MYLVTSDNDKETWLEYVERMEEGRVQKQVF